MLATGGALAVVAAATAFVVLRGGDDETSAATIGRDGSTRVDGAADVEIATDIPAAVTITYRVQTAGDEISTVTDVVHLRRPFEARVDTTSDGDLVSTRVGWFAHTGTESPGAQPSVLEVAPSVPSADLRLERVLPLAVERDLVERREVRQVAGRRCQVYRSRQTLVAPIRPPTDTEHTDSCVDATGLLLEEVVTVDDAILTRRVAIEVDTSPDGADEAFRVEGTPVEASKGGGFVRRVKEGSTPPGEFLVVDAPPAGYEHLGRFSVVPPQPENFGDDITREASRRAGIVEVWRRGADLIVLDQGGTLRGADAFEPTEGAPKVAVGGVGEGELLLSGSGIEVRVARPGGRYLRVYGTAPLDELLAVAASVRPTEGGTLELEDAPVGDQP